MKLHGGQRVCALVAVEATGKLSSSLEEVARKEFAVLYWNEKL